MTTAPGDSLLWRAFCAIEEERAFCQTAITKDNVKIKIDGVLYFKISDPYKASYAVNKPINAISMLA